MVLKKECQFCVRGMEAEGFFFAPIHFMNGVHSSWANFFATKGNFKLDSEQDFINALKVLQKIPKQLEQLQKLCRKGISRGLTFHEASMSRVLKQYESLNIDKVEDSKFYIPFKQASVDIQERAKSAIQNDVLPAFQQLKIFVENVYMKMTRKWPGLSYVPNGEQKYQRYLEYHTTIEGITPEEVHNTGLEEVERLQTLVVQTGEQALGFVNATFKEIMSSVKNDAKQSFDNEDEIMKYFQDIIDNIAPKLKLVMDDTLLNNDTYNLQLKKLPAGSGGLAYYIRPTVDGRRKGAFYINTNNIQNIQKFESNSLTLHEGNPGHHLQLSFNNYSPNPEFLRQPVSHLDQEPGIPLNYNSHIEGWGLYAEYLGHEMGMFNDPEQAIGFYSWNLLRACRLVVDTGLHVFGWSRQRAIDYLLENTAMSLSAIEQQIDRWVHHTSLPSFALHYHAWCIFRYITWPAQATSYKIGEMKIQEIRKRRKRELGSDFDLGAFHRHVLTCIGPIEMLEECILEEEQLPFPKVTKPPTKYTTTLTPLSTTEQSTNGTNDLLSSTTSSKSFKCVSPGAILMLSLLFALIAK